MDLTQCGRIGCVRPAVGVLLIAAQEQRAWLVGLGHDEASEGVPLCHEHADRISVPLGWQIEDARTPVAPRRRRRRAASRTALPFEPELDLDIPAADSELDRLPESDRLPEPVRLPEPEPLMPEVVPTLAVVPPAAEDADHVPAVEITEVTTIEVTTVEVTTVEVVAALAVEHHSVAEVDDKVEVEVDDDEVEVEVSTVPPVSPTSTSQAHRELSATERTPLLQRAFRIAGD